MFWIILVDFGISLRSRTKVRQIFEQKPILFIGVQYFIYLFIFIHEAYSLFLLVLFLVYGQYSQHLLH